MDKKKQPKRGGWEKISKVIFFVLLVYCFYVTRQWVIWQRNAEHYKEWKNWWYEYSVNLEEECYGGLND